MTRLRTMWRRSPRTTIGLALVVVIALAALLAPLVAPYATTDQDAAVPLQGPVLAHLFGTDELGQDVFTRVLYGGRPTLLVAGGTVAAALAIGAPLGLLAGFFGGWRDFVIMRVVEFGFSMPALVLAIAVIAFLGKGTLNVILALTIVFAPLIARVARAATLSVRQQPFIRAAEASGDTALQIMARQVVPNIAAPVLVQGALVFAYAILAEASLSFLGLGSSEPVPSWGRMLKDALPLADVAPWAGIFPGLMIALTVIGLNMVGDGLRDVLDPRGRRSAAPQPDAAAAPPASPEGVRA